MKQTNIFFIALFLSVVAVGFVMPYTPPNYNSINFTLCSEYIPPLYNSINFTLGFSDDCGVCPTTANCTIDCSTNPIWNVNVSVYGDLILKGAGEIYSNEFINFAGRGKVYKDDGCKLHIRIR